MDCPECDSSKHVKDGIVKGKQRYKCKNCGLRYTVTSKHDISPHIKRLALVLYIQGLSTRDVGQCLGYSHVTVNEWVRLSGLDKSFICKEDRNENISGTKKWVERELKDRTKLGWLLVSLNK